MAFCQSSLVLDVGAVSAIVEAEKDEFFGAIKNCPRTFSVMLAVSEAPYIF